jgi:hypothetical protein
MPMLNTMYIASEMLRVSRVRTVIHACGTKAPVVSKAAMNPMDSGLTVGSREGARW